MGMCRICDIIGSNVFPRYHASNVREICTNCRLPFIISNNPDLANIGGVLTNLIDTHIDGDVIVSNNAQLTSISSGFASPKHVSGGSLEPVELEPMPNTRPVTDTDAPGASANAYLLRSRTR